MDKGKKEDILKNLSEFFDVLYEIPTRENIINAICDKLIEVSGIELSIQFVHDIFNRLNQIYIDGQRLKEKRIKEMSSIGDLMVSLRSSSKEKSFVLKTFTDSFIQSTEGEYYPIYSIIRINGKDVDQLISDSFN